MGNDRIGRGGDRRSGKSYGPNLVRYRLKCQGCPEWFNAARPDALYHSIACKSRAQRARGREDRGTAVMHPPKPEPPAPAPAKKKPTRSAPAKKKPTRSAPAKKKPTRSAPAKKKVIYRTYAKG